MTSLLCAVKRLHMFDPRTTFVAESAPLLAFHIPYWVSRYGMRWQMLSAQHQHRTKHSVSSQWP